MQRSHSGYPHRGESAISTLLQVLNKLEAESWPHSDLLGPSTFNIGKISGGEGYNVVAPKATALCAVRVATNVALIKKKVTAIVAEFTNVEVAFQFEYPETLLDWQLDGGFEAAPVSYGTDVPRLQGSHKKVLYGPGTILVAHGKNEHVKISELVESVAGYKKLVIGFLGDIN